MDKLFVSLFVCVFVCGFVVSFEIDTYPLLMPDVYPHRDELYLCTPIRIAPTKNYYIVGFDPNATMHTAHHMILYGCSEPGSNESVWGCGEMASNEIDDAYSTASPCASGSQIVYAWARDAPSLHLPENVGFLVGQDSPIKYLVLQVHYMSRFPQGKTDNSGVFLKYTRRVMPRQAGVILLGTGGVVAPNKVEHMETACTMQEEKVIHPFAFRTHTHALGFLDEMKTLVVTDTDILPHEVRLAMVVVVPCTGKLVAGYVVQKHPSTGDKWRLLGRKNPQLPQMFYPIEDQTPISKGDILAARCTMNNTHDFPVRIGATNKDEMCNFYIMYWVEDGAPLDQKYCFSPGPPYYFWSRAPQSFNIIPEKDD